LPQMQQVERKQTAPEGAVKTTAMTARCARG
jgi:hypothetical protein